VAPEGGGGTDVTFHLLIPDGACEAPVALPAISPARFDRRRCPADLVPRPALLDPLTPIDTPDLLTNRERDVLKLLEARLSHEEIASTLGISIPTVKRHAANAYRKLSVTSRGPSVRQGSAHCLNPHD
jgi:DNA-binding NarL/FixJ family response regulator